MESSLQPDLLPEGPAHATSSLWRGHIRRGDGHRSTGGKRSSTAQTLEGYAPINVMHGRTSMHATGVQHASKHSIIQTSTIQCRSECCVRGMPRNVHSWAIVPTNARTHGSRFVGSACSAVQVYWAATRIRASASGACIYHDRVDSFSWRPQQPCVCSTMR